MTKTLKPIGFCHGVANTIDIINKAAEHFPTRPILLLGSPVHNQKVMDRLKNYPQVEFIKNITKRDDNPIIIFQAHGHKMEDEELANKYGYMTLDAICPFLSFRNNQVEKMAHSQNVVLIGDKNHSEMIALKSKIPEATIYDPTKDEELKVDLGTPYLFVFQSTLDIETYENLCQAFKAKTNKGTYISICHEVKRRNDEIGRIKDIKPNDICLVVGDETSANTMALYKKAQSRFGERAYRILDVSKLPDIDYSNVNDIYLVSGTSASIVEVEEIIRKLNA